LENNKKMTLEVFGKPQEVKEEKGKNLNEKISCCSKKYL